MKCNGKCLVAYEDGSDVAVLLMADDDCELHGDGPTVTIPQAEYDALVAKAGLAERMRQWTDSRTGKTVCQQTGVELFSRWNADYDALTPGATGEGKG